MIRSVDRQPVSKAERARQKGEGSLGKVSRKRQNAAFGVPEATQGQAEKGQIKMSAYLCGSYKFAYNTCNLFNNTTFTIKSYLLKTGTRSPSPK